MKPEQKKVTYAHAIDGRDGQQEVIPRGFSVQPNAGLSEAVDATGNPGRLRCEYNVGKKPETKRLQGLN